MRASTLLVASFFVFAGCEKALKPIMLGSLSPTTLGDQTVLVIGQSNNERFQQYGEAAFIQEYRKRFPSAAVKFINCSVGGTSISQWQADGQLFDGCSPIFHGVKPTVILFYQGEADAYLGTTNWPQQFTNAVHGWRKIVGDIPVIYAQIAVEDSTLYCPQAQWDSIQLQQTEVFLWRVSMIKTADISALDPDPAVSGGVHLSPQSYVNIAVRYVQAIEGME